MRAVYPGTFDPFTNGHLDVVRRGRELFSQLVVAVAESGRKRPFFPLGERVRMARESVRGLAGVAVESFDGTLVDFLDSQGAQVVLRGLRTGSDFDHESRMTLFNRLLDDGVETVFLLSSPACAAINAGLVREVAAMGADVSALVPPPVARRLKARFGRKPRRESASDKRLLRGT